MNRKISSILLFALLPLTLTSCFLSVDGDENLTEKQKIISKINKNNLTLDLTIDVSLKDKAFLENEKSTMNIKSMISENGFYNQIKSEDIVLYEELYLNQESGVHYEYFSKIADREISGIIPEATISSLGFYNYFSVINGETLSLKEEKEVEGNVIYRYQISKTEQVLESLEDMISIYSHYNVRGYLNTCVFYTQSLKTFYTIELSTYEVYDETLGKFYQINLNGELSDFGETELPEGIIPVSGEDEQI